MTRATSIKDVDQHEATKSIAHFLKKSGKVKVPEWSDLVKLGVNKELAPVDPDWFYTRAASLARHLYFRPAGNFLLTKSLLIFLFRNRSLQEGLRRKQETWCCTKPFPNLSWKLPQKGCSATREDQVG